MDLVACCVSTKQLVFHLYFFFTHEPQNKKYAYFGLTSFQIFHHGCYSVLSLSLSLPPSGYKSRLIWIWFHLFAFFSSFLFHTVCNFIVHEKCIPSVVTPCSSIAPCIIKNPVAHCWSEPTHHKRKFCTVCRKRFDESPAVHCMSKYRWHSHASSAFFSSDNWKCAYQLNVFICFFFMQYANILHMSIAKILPYPIARRMPLMFQAKSYRRWNIM